LTEARVPRLPSKILQPKIEPMNIEPSFAEKILVLLKPFCRRDVRIWNRDDFHRQIQPRGYRHEPDDPEIPRALRSLEADGWIRFIDKDDCFIEVLRVEYPKRPVKHLLIGGFERWFGEGMRLWSRKSLHGMINPRDDHHVIEDSDVQQALQELEQEGRIRIIGDEDRYLEVLRL
jgi:hypothetical protein